MVFCDILYKVGELDGETERIVASPNHFSPKRARRRGNLKIPRLRTPSVDDDLGFVLKNDVERNAGVNYVFAKIGPKIGDLGAAPNNELIEILIYRSR